MVIIKRNTANKYRNKTYKVLLWLFERNENFQRAIFFYKNYSWYCRNSAKDKSHSRIRLNRKYSFVCYLLFFLLHLVIYREMRL